jgi:Raf kinase inhibitor-like YbhB/YbcL family protein
VDDASVLDASSDAPLGMDTPALPLALTSSKFAEGDSLPKDYTCSGLNVSPPFSWSPGVSAASSYALVVNDVTIKFLHSVIYDIAPSTLGLPESVEKAYTPMDPMGAKQTRSYLGTFGYAGPCPPSGDHTYEFVLYALDVPSLPNASQTMSLKAAETEIKKHVVATSRLSAHYIKP